jgi:ubiquinone/menaquinone biosynthesis C-methylase UbiE
MELRQMTSTTAISTARPAANNVSLGLDSEELASTYERVSTRQFNHGKLLIAALAPRPGERILDVGCGTGRLGDYVAGLVAPDGEVVGLDPLPLRIDIAARKNPRFKASVGRAEDLTRFADNSFDVVYMNSVFHWVEDKARALNEVRRVLKPGGRFGVNSADASRPHQSAALVRDAVLQEGLSHAKVASALGTNYRVGQKELGELLASAGLIDVHVDAHTFVDTLDGVDDLFAWSQSSSFGNFLSDLEPDERERVRTRLSAQLDELRTPDGIQLERYLVFATGRRA